jgi:hypothetical protein
LDSGSSKVHVELLCNQYEYEILYKRTFSNVLIKLKTKEENNAQHAPDAPPGLEQRSRGANPGFPTIIS